MEFKDLVIAGLIIGLFILAIGNFAIQIAVDNNASVLIMENREFNESFGDLSSELDTSKDTAEAQREVLETEIPESGTEILLKAPKIIATTFTTVLRNIYTMSFGLIQKTLGIPPIITTTITAILIILVVLGVWALIKIGR